MSHDHRTAGFEKYENFVRTLKIAGVPVVEGEEKYVVHGTQWYDHMCGCGYDPLQPDESCPCCREECNHLQRMRFAVFSKQGKTLLVVEEWIEEVNPDGRSGFVGIAVYPLGHRPELKPKVLTT